MTKYERRMILTLVTLAVVFIALLVVALLVRRTKPESPATSNENTSVISPQDQAVQRLTTVAAQAAPDNRLLFYGADLLNVPVASLNRELGTASTSLQPDFSLTPEGVTTRTAVEELTAVLKLPPKYLVLDIGRYDAANDIASDETIANLRLVVTKATEVGSRVIVVAGDSANGTAQLAELERSSLSGVIVVDASGLLMTSAYRASPTELNAQGKERLAALIAEQVRKIETP